MRRRLRLAEKNVADQQFHWAERRIRVGRNNAAPRQRLVTLFDLSLGEQGIGIMNRALDRKQIEVERDGHRDHLRAVGCGQFGWLPKAPTMRRRQHPAGYPAGDNCNSVTSEICPARWRTSSASGAVHVAHKIPSSRDAAEAMGAATCLRRWWSATAWVNASKCSRTDGSLP